MKGEKVKGGFLTLSLLISWHGILISRDIDMSEKVKIDTQDPAPEQA
jgi:hypothetical protein